MRSARTTSRFAADEIAPLAAEIDRTNDFPRQLWPKMGELGLHGVTVEEEFGGLGLGYLEACHRHGGGVPRFRLGGAVLRAPTPIFASIRSAAGVPPSKSSAICPS